MSGLSREPNRFAIEDVKRNYLRGGRRNWRVRFFDETEYWNEDLVAKLPAGFRVVSAYMFDPGTVTHCCSFSGSQWHVGISTFLAPPPGFDWFAWKESLGDAYEELIGTFEESYPDSFYAADMGIAKSLETDCRVLRGDEPGEYNEDDALQCLQECSIENDFFKDGVTVADRY